MKWTASDDALLRRYWMEGKSPKVIAAKIERSVKGIHNRRTVIGLQPQACCESRLPRYRKNMAHCRLCYASLISIAEHYQRGNYCYRQECTYMNKKDD